MRRVYVVASKRKYKDSKQDMPFELPEFDEKEYLEEQLKIGRGVFFSILWAVIIAIFTYFVYIMFRDPWTYIFIPGILGMLSLYLILPKLKVPLSEIKMKSWLNFVFAFGLTWIAVVIIALNPPFSDFADPIIDGDDYRTLSRQEFNATEPSVHVRALIVDNYKLGKCEVTITYPDEIGITPRTQTHRLRNEEGNLFAYYIPDEIVEKIIGIQQNGTHLPIEYTIVARDSRDNERETSGSFIIIEENRIPIFLEGEANPFFREEKGRIELYLFDNSEFKELFFTVNTYNGDGVQDNEKYSFKLPDGFEIDEKTDEIRYDYHGSVRDFKKGDYNITITAVDAGNNTITMDWEFTMEKNGADYGKDENKGMLPFLGPFELVGAMVIGIAIIVFSGIGHRKHTVSIRTAIPRTLSSCKLRIDSNSAPLTIWKRKGERSDR